MRACGLRVGCLSEVDDVEEYFMGARVVFVLLERGIFFVVMDVEGGGRIVPRSAADVERPFE